MFVLLAVSSSLFKSTFLWSSVLTQLQMLVKSMDCWSSAVFSYRGCFFGILSNHSWWCESENAMCVFFCMCGQAEAFANTVEDGNGWWQWSVNTQQLGLPDYSSRWWVGVQLNWLMDMSCPDWCWTNRNYWHQGQASSSRIGSSDLK